MKNLSWLVNFHLIVAAAFLWGLRVKKSQREERIHDWKKAIFHWLSTNQRSFYAFFSPWNWIGWIQTPLRLSSWLSCAHKKCQTDTTRERKRVSRDLDEYLKHKSRDENDEKLVSLSHSIRIFFFECRQLSQLDIAAVCHEVVRIHFSLEENISYHLSAYHESCDLRQLSSQTTQIDSRDCTIKFFFLGRTSTKFLLSSLFSPFAVCIVISAI